MSLKKWLCVPALLTCFLHSLTAGTVFLTPADNSGNSITVYTGDPLAFASTITGPSGAFQVLPSSSPNKYYAVGRSAGDTLAILQGTFPNLMISRSVNLNQAATGATLTSDGQRLAVLAGGVHLLDTTTDQLLVTGGPLPVGPNPVGIVATFDPGRVVALSAQKLTLIDATQGFVLNSITIPGQATALTMGPNGLLYVSAQDAIHEIDPNTLVIRSTYAVHGTPGRLSFTPDARAALAVNTSPTGAYSGFALDLSGHKVFELPTVGAGFDKVIVVNSTTAYALSIAQGRVWVLSLTAGTDGSTITNALPLTIDGAPLEGVRDITASNEGDRTRFLYLATSNSVYRYDVAGAALTGPLSTPTIGNLSFAATPSTSPVSAVVLANADQQLGPGQTSVPLVVRALDGLGNPVAGLPVKFTTSAAGITIQGATPQTGLQGYAQAYVQIPQGANAGSIQITPTVGSYISPTPFTITINTTGTGGNGGSGGSNQSGGLSIVQGQGQVLSTNSVTSLQEPLKIKLQDAQGNPKAGATINWSLVQGQGNVFPSVTTTDANGIATADFAAVALTPSLSYLQSVIQASTGTETVTFYVTTVPGPIGTSIQPVIKPESRVISVRSGEVLTNAVEITAQTLDGTRVPNVGLRVTNVNDPAAQPNGSCRGGYVLTNDQGVASCDFIATGTGTGVVQAVVGSQRYYDFTLNVLPAAVARIAVTSGNNQSGTVGQQLSTPLAATITDANNQPLTGVDVTWEVVKAGGATLSNQVTRSDAQGRVSSQVTLGNTPGPVQVRVRTASGAASATFTLTVNSNANQIQATSGDAQSAVIGQAFAQPLQVRLTDASGKPVSGAQVTYSIVSGSATPASQVVATGADGLASATITAGQAPGPIVVQATSGSLKATFKLTARLAGPSFTAAAIVNGASFRPGISPGSIATIFGSGIAPNLQGTATPSSMANGLPTRLSDVEVLFNGISAPIYAVSNINGQESVTVQVPFELAPGAASVTIRTANGASSTVDNVPVSALSPGVFELTDPANGRRYAVAYRPDGSVVTSTNPAHPGDLLRVYATGLGQVSSATATNRFGTGGQTINATFVMGINNHGVRTDSSEYANGAIGLYMIRFEVPADEKPSPAAPLGLVMTDANGTRVDANSTYIPIQ